MNNEDGFLHAIMETPDDDVPRLVYADWLEEHGDPRAELIRVQCAEARLAADDQDRHAVCHQESLTWLHQCRLGRVRERLCHDVARLGSSVST